MKRFRRLLALDWRDRLLLLEAWLYLGAARFALLVLPFRLIAPRLGPQLEVGDDSPSRGVAPQVAQRVSRAVTIMAQHTPWESACLAQAMAGRSMLRRRGVASILYLGTRRDDTGNLAAHAWLRVGSAIVLGGQDYRVFAALAAFGDRPHRGRP